MPRPGAGADRRVPFFHAEGPLTGEKENNQEGGVAMGLTGMQSAGVGPVPAEVVPVFRPIPPYYFWEGWIGSEQRKGSRNERMS